LDGSSKSRHEIQELINLLGVLLALKIDLVHLLGKTVLQGDSKAVERWSECGRERRGGNCLKLPCNLPRESIDNNADGLLALHSDTQSGGKDGLKFAFEGSWNGLIECLLDCLLDCVADSRCGGINEFGQDCAL
jgi:hypothetical protein